MTPSLRASDNQLGLFGLFGDDTSATTTATITAPVPPAAVVPTVRPAHRPAAPASTPLLSVAGVEAALVTPAAPAAALSPGRGAAKARAKTPRAVRLEEEAAAGREMLSTEAFVVLRTVEIESCAPRRGETAARWVVRLTSGQLEKAVYAEVNEALSRIGGQWDRSAGGHTFPHDPTPLVAAVIGAGTMPPKNPTAFFPTPARIVELMLAEAHLDCGGWDWMRVLEPSAGSGAICDAVRAACPEIVAAGGLDVVEAFDLNARVLREKGYDVQECDFLGFEPRDGEAPYHVILMNPPFSVRGDALAYVTHIERAWRMLRPNGTLVAITPNFLHRGDARTTWLRDLVTEYGSFEVLGKGAFAESGTGVDTLMITIEKTAKPERREPHDGAHCAHCWVAAVTAENDFKQYERLDGLFRAHAPLFQAAADALDAGADAAHPAVAAVAPMLRAYYTEAVAAAEKENVEGGGGVLVKLLPECHADLVRGACASFRESTFAQGGAEEEATAALAGAGAEA